MSMNAELARSIEVTTTAMYNANHDLIRIIGDAVWYRTQLVAWLSKDVLKQEMLYKYAMSMPRAFFLVMKSPYVKMVEICGSDVIKCGKAQDNTHLNEVQKSIYVMQTAEFLKECAYYLEIEEVRMEEREYQAIKGNVYTFAPHARSTITQAFSRLILHKTREDEANIKRMQEEDALHGQFNADGTAESTG